MDAFSSIRHLLSTVLPPLPQVEEAAVPAGTIRSGLGAFDDARGGWRTGEVTIVGGDPGAGKSALLYGAALFAAITERVPVALVPLKHSLATCAGRLVCAHAGVRFARFRGAALSDEERSRLTPAAEELEGAPLYIHTAPELTLAELLEHVRRVVRYRGVRFVVVDGLSALRLDGEFASRIESVGSLVRELAIAAAELDVAILASVEAPVLSVAAAAAKLTLLIERSADAADPGAASLRVVRGPGFDGDPIPLRFHPELLRFTSLLEV